MSAIDSGSGFGSSSSGFNSSSSFNTSSTTEGLGLDTQIYPDTKSSSLDSFKASASQFTSQVKEKAGIAQKQIANYAGSAQGYAKENPFFVALAFAGIGLLAGAFLARRRVIEL